MSTTVVVTERERAKQIIAEIIRQAGGTLTSKTRLVQAFWRAHVGFAECQPGYLSFWPLLKTPAGPVIKEIDLLLGELVTEGVLQIDETTTAGVSALRLELTEQAATGEDVSPEAIQSIQSAVAGEPLELAKIQLLKSWNEAADGEELNIYIDPIPDGEYADRKNMLCNLACALNSA